MQSLIKKSQQGIAIITALLIVALAATTASYLLWQQSLWTRQLENLTARSKANAVAHAAAQLARGQLNQFYGTKPFYLLLGKPVPLPAEGLSLVGTLFDEQAKFNVNNMLTGMTAPTGTPTPPPTGAPTPPPNPIAPTPQLASQNIFKNLLVNLKLPPVLLTSLLAWIDNTNQQQDDLTYLSLDPPYRSAHRFMVDINELYRVQGFTPEIVEKLRPFITALPPATAININTAPAQLLEAAGVPAAVVATIVKVRDKDPFLTQADVTRLLPGTTLPAEVSFESQFFLVHGRVGSGNVDIGYSALMERKVTTPPSWPVIIWQQQGIE
jgi:general secretion pathway protein K